MKSAGEQEFVTLAQLRRRRPVDEKAVARERDAILAGSRANRLAEVRKDARLTQQQLAERLGVDQPRISRIEHGDLSRIEVGSLAAYAEAVGGTLELLVRVDGREYPLSAS